MHHISERSLFCVQICTLLRVKICNLIIKIYIYIYIGNSNSFVDLCLCIEHHNKPNVHDPRYLKHMMTSSNGNIFRVTGYLCGEFTGYLESYREASKYIRPLVTSTKDIAMIRDNVWFVSLLFSLFHVVICYAKTKLFVFSHVATFARRWKLKPIFMEDKGHSILTHWDRAEMYDISQTKFSHAFSWMKVYWFLLAFDWSLFLNVQLTIFQHWLR